MAGGGVDVLVARVAGPVNRVLPPVPDHPDNERFWWHDPHYVRESRHSCCVEA